MMKKIPEIADDSMISLGIDSGNDQIAIYLFNILRYSRKEIIGYHTASDILYEKVVRPQEEIRILFIKV